MSSEELLSQQRPGVLRFGGARMALLDIEAGFWSLRRQLETLIGQRLTDSVLQQAGANGGASFAQAFGGSGQAADGERALRDCVAAYQAAGFGRFEIEAVEWPIGRLLIRADDSFEAWMIRQHKEGHRSTACAYTAGVLVGFVNVLTGRQDIVCVERACQASGAEHCLFELLPAEAAGGAPVVSMDPDPGLSRQLNLLESLFDRTPMGIAIFDQDYILRRYNPTWAGFADRYAPPSAVDIAPGVYYFDLLPGTEPTVLPLFEKVMAGEVVQLEAVRLESEGVVSYWDVVLAPILEGDEVSGILNVTIDATERVEAHQELETALRRLQQREERLARVMKGINDGIWDWNIETGEVYFSPRWKSMLGYAEGEITNRFESWKMLIHPDDLERASAEIEEHLQGRTPLYYLEHRLRHKDGSYRWILARGQAVRDQEGRAYRLVGSHTDISVQKRAEAALQYRAAFESIVSSISTDFINMPLEEIDSGIHEALRVVGEFMGVDRSYVFRFSEDYGWMNCTHEWSAPGVEPQIDSLQGLSVEDLAWSNRQLLRGESLHIPRVADLPPEAEVERQEFERQGIQSLIVVPMVYRGATVGFVGFDSVREPKVWSEDSIQLLHLVAAVFVNALEHKQAQEALHAAYQSLEQRVEERTRALASLLEVSHNVASTLELGPLLEVILDQLQTVVDYTGASVLTLDDGCLAVRAYRGPIDQNRVLTLRFPLADAPANKEVVRLQKPVIIPDVRSDTSMARRFQDGAGEELDTTFGYVRSWLGVPLMVKDEVMGMLTLDHEEPDFYGPPQAGLVYAFANQVAVAIENARLYEAEQERLEESERRRRVAEGLRGVLAILNSERPLDDILHYIVEQARHLMGCQAAVVYRLALEQGLINIEVASGMPEAFQRLDAMPYGDTEPNRAAVSGQTFAIEDVQERWAHLDLDLGEQDPSVQEWASIVGQHFGAYLSAPIVVGDQVYGAISLFYDQPRSFAEEEIDLAASFADQAALAIENARLRAQAEEAAIAAERNRLARDLHDAVTQTLFSSSLIAEVLPRLWERSPEEGLRRLAELRELTRGALAEMRTLLLELRPTALAEANLADLLRQLAESITGRARVPVSLEVEGECVLEAEVKVALYRIAQEALNNVAKHAGASKAKVRLSCQPGQVELGVNDDGVGFAPGTVAPNSLGLGIMRERAEAIGAALVVESRPGQGTQVSAIWKADSGR